MWIIAGIAFWFGCGIAGHQIILRRFGRNLGGFDDLMIGPCMLIGPIALFIALGRAPHI